MSAAKLTKKQKFTLDDRYKEFLARNAKPKDDVSNTFNLFDDSNKKDRLWRTIASTHLAVAKVTL